MSASTGPWQVHGPLISVCLCLVKRHSKLLSHFATNQDQVIFCRQDSTCPSCQRQGHLNLLCVHAAPIVQTYLPTRKFSIFRFPSVSPGETQAAKKTKCARLTVRLPKVKVYLQTLAVVWPASREKDFNKANPFTTKCCAPPAVTVSVPASKLSCSESTSSASATVKAMLKR